MKYLLLLPLFLFVSISSFSQSSAGLIAHWDMNGSGNDVSGNGHTGHLHNVTAAAGVDGIPNTAYYFNGVNSSITTGYLPDLNLTLFSICAKIKVMGFGSGSCQTNFIVKRGRFSVAGNYSLYFYDNPFDGDNCTLRDTTNDVMVTNAGTHGAATSLWQYTPTTIENIWYKFVATWDGSQWKIYVNDTLKVTVVSPTGTFGTSTDSISIGMDAFDALTGPFKGIIDDIKIFNRVLADTEVVQYGNTCGTITADPSPASIIAGANAVYTVSTTIASPVYQWQQDGGTGFISLTNSGIYSGVYTNTLTITGASIAVNNFHYRCVVSNTSGCADTSTSALLSVTTGVNSLLTSDMVSIYPNPTHDHAIIQLPTINGSYSVQLINPLGQVVLRNNFTGNKLSLDLSMLPAGIYILKVQHEDNIIYKKLIKN